MADDTDDTGGLRGLLSAWAAKKRTEWTATRHRLQQDLENYESFIDTDREYSDETSFQSRRAERDQLKQYHDIRVDGGIIASLLEARALMVFGVGGEFTAEQDAVAEWVNSQFDQLDLTTLDIGTDGYFYGYALTKFRETLDGDFGELEFIQPWTTVPQLDNRGNVVEWEQKITHGRGTSEKTFDPEDLYHFTVRKQSGRDPVGMSMLGQVMTEATAYRDNQDAIQNAVQLHGFPKYHVKVGPDDGATIDDNELRRIRPKFSNIHELTKWITGQDVDIDVISPEGFEFEQITEHDLSKLAIAMMLPVELTQLGGGDGLGTGFPARLRERLFLLSAKADQRTVGGQMVGMGKDMIAEYAPPEVEALISDLDEFDLRFEFGDPITDMDELQSKVNAVGQDMTVNERRNLFDLPPVDDDGVGEQYEPPGRPDPDAGASPEPDDGGVDIAMQTGNLSADMIEWIRTFAAEDGSLDDDVATLGEWLEQFADEPATVRRQFRNGVVVFANAQGIEVQEAVEQPVERLLSYYAENRNLQDAPGNGEEPPDPEKLLEEIEAYRGGFEDIVWAERSE